MTQRVFVQQPREKNQGIYQKHCFPYVIKEFLRHRLHKDKCKCLVSLYYHIKNDGEEHRHLSLIELENY